jgi:hypothetical protein
MLIFVLVFVLVLVGAPVAVAVDALIISTDSDSEFLEEPRLSSEQRVEALVQVEVAASVMLALVAAVTAVATAAAAGSCSPLQYRGVAAKSRKIKSRKKHRPASEFNAETAPLRAELAELWGPPDPGSEARAASPAGKVPDARGLLVVEIPRTFIPWALALV